MVHKNTHTKKVVFINTATTYILVVVQNINHYENGAKSFSFDKL